MEWEKILIGLLAVAFLFFFGPSALRSIGKSPKGTAQDWKAALIPIALVVGFVILLIVMVRN